jgi:hypothetical protein
VIQFLPIQGVSHFAVISGLELLQHFWDVLRRTVGALEQSPGRIGQSQHLDTPFTVFLTVEDFAKIS